MNTCLFMLVSGYGLNGKENVVIVELKQWEMEAIVLEKNRARNRARILAGYCWNWPKATRNNTNFHDIEIGDYSISWNLNGGDAFAISDESVHEAGCIHTSQGLEFDYTGVIIGNDMRFENGKVITDYTKRAKTDNSLKGIKTLAKKDKEKAEQVADEIIKNTYRTLMTRGMKGCYVYCTDAALAQYFKKLLKQKNRNKKHGIKTITLFSDSSKRTELYKSSRTIAYYPANAFQTNGSI
ncbi:DNA/RNA helicase domain-containing protein [Anaerobutyricum soehngenii]|uniref:DNA/RNA helicase domain-containing protein n=1 Tax=Anaerobutyricum soehngenii TaxID=105843 RepID=UPI002ED6359E